VPYKGATVQPFNPSTNMYLAIRIINGKEFTPLEFKSWQAAYKYLKSAEKSWNFMPNKNYYQYNIAVINPSGNEIHKIILL
jgi:hypothetical protein